MIALLVSDCRLRPDSSYQLGCLTPPIKNETDPLLHPQYQIFGSVNDLSSDAPRTEGCLSLFRERFQSG
jgi:hypothetical protein